MKKLNKIFGVLLTTALLTGLLVTSAVPVAAGDNSWTEFKIPGSTGNVMANNIVDSGLLTQSADGSVLFAAVTDDDGDSYLAKSNDGGKTWDLTLTPAFTGTVWDHVAGDWDIQAIAVSPSDPNVVYISGMRTVFKSMDGGETFAKMAAVPDNFSGSEFITSMDVAMAGGSYKVVVGTKIWGSNDGNVYFMDEGEFFYAFDTIGTPSFATANPGYDVIDVKLSSDFANDKGIVVLAHNSDGAGDTIVSFNVNGGAWNSTIKNAVISSSYPWGEIGLPSDFNILTHNQFYVAGNEGVYRVFGGATTSNAALLPWWDSNSDDVKTIDVLGPFANAVIAVGDDWDNVTTSTDGGMTWTEGENITGSGENTFVAIAKDFDTSGTIYALTQADGINDESGFQVSQNQGANFVQRSLLNSSIDEINDVAFGVDGDIFMITYDTFNGDDSLWRYTSDNGWERVMAEDYTGDDFDSVQIVDGVVYMSDWQDIMVSNDNGISFSELPFNAGYTINDFVVVDSQTFVVATNSGIFRTTNGGFFWDEVDDTANVTILNVSSDNSSLVAATDAGTVLISDDMGATWDDVGGTLADITDVTFRNGSNTQLWASAAVSSSSTTPTIERGPDQYTLTASAAGEAVAITGDVSVAVTFDLDADTVIGIGGVTFGDAGDVVTITANSATTSTWVGGTPTAALVTASDLDTSMDDPTDGSVTMNMNPINGTPVVTYSGGGLYMLDASDSSPSWDQMDFYHGTDIWAHDADSTVFAGMAVVSGIGGPQGMIYGLDADGTVTRIKCRDNRSTSDLYPETIPDADGSGAQMLIVPGAGANQLWVNTGDSLYTYTDTLAVFGSGLTVDSFTKTTATISWDAVPGATNYAVGIKAGTSAISNPFINSYDETDDLSYTFTGLDADTTYFVRVWAVEPVSSFHVGGTTLATQPDVPTSPYDGLAPGPGATNVPVNPSFQWAPVPGATQYNLEVSTSPDFSDPMTRTSAIEAFAWTGDSLENNTVYYWRVNAQTGTGTSDWVTSVFTTVEADDPPVTVTQTSQPGVTLTIPAQETPGYIWIIIGVGAILTILVIVLIVRTRRVV